MSQTNPSPSNATNSLTNSSSNSIYKNLNLIDLAKKYINKSELVESEFYIILSLLISNPNINDKINLLIEL